LKSFRNTRANRLGFRSFERTGATFRATYEL